MKNNKLLALALSAGLVVGVAAPSFAAEEEAPKLGEGVTVAQSSDSDLTAEGLFNGEAKEGEDFVKENLPEGTVNEEKTVKVDGDVRVSEKENKNDFKYSDDLRKAGDDVVASDEEYEEAAKEFNKANDKLQQAPKDKKVFTIDEYNAYNEAKDNQEKASENAESSLLNLGRYEDASKQARKDYDKANEEREIARKEYQDAKTELDKALDFLDKASLAVKPKLTGEAAEVYSNYQDARDAYIKAIENSDFEGAQSAINDIAKYSAEFEKLGVVEPTQYEKDKYDGALEGYQAALDNLNNKLVNLSEADQRVAKADAAIKKADQDLANAKAAYEGAVKALNEANEKLNNAPQGSYAYDVALKEYEAAQEKLNKALIKKGQAEDEWKKVKDGKTWVKELAPKINDQEGSVKLVYHPVDGKEVNPSKDPKKDLFLSTDNANDLKWKDLKVIPAAELEPSKPRIFGDDYVGGGEYKPAPTPAPSKDKEVVVPTPGPSVDHTVVVPTPAPEVKPVVEADEDINKLIDDINAGTKEIKDTLAENEANQPADEPAKDPKKPTPGNDDDDDNNVDPVKVVVKEKVKVVEAPKAAAKHSNPKTGVAGMSAVAGTLAVSMAGIVATRKRNDR